LESIYLIQITCNQLLPSTDYNMKTVDLATRQTLQQYLGVINLLKVFVAVFLPLDLISEAQDGESALVHQTNRSLLLGFFPLLNTKKDIMKNVGKQ